MRFDPNVVPPILGAAAAILDPTFAGGAFIGVALGGAAGVLNAISSIRNRRATLRLVVTDILGGVVAGAVVYVVSAHAFSPKMAVIAAGFAGLLVFDIQDVLKNQRFLSAILNRLAGVKNGGGDNGK